MMRDVAAWKFPELVTDLRTTSKQVALDAGERRELQQLRATRTALGAKTQQAERRAQELEHANKELTAKVAAYEANTFKVREGESKHFAPGWWLGVADVNPVYNQVDVQYGNESKTMKPSNYFIVDADDTRYIVTLIKVEPVTFQVSSRLIPK